MPAYVHRTSSGPLQRGRFAGLRYFVLAERWLVYYRIEPDRNVLVFDLLPARARP